MADDNAETPGDEVAEETTETTTPEVVDTSALERAIADLSAEKENLNIQVSDLLAQVGSLTEQLAAARAANLALLTGASSVAEETAEEAAEEAAEVTGVDSLFNDPEED